MRILVAGARGFIGSALVAAFAAAGHEVWRGVRRPEGARDLPLDYARPIDRAAWRERLHEFDAFVNAVGILVEGRGQRFEAVHHRGPVELFEAAAAAGVRRVLQVSALGAEGGSTPYFASKRAADLRLAQLPLAWQVLRPSLVFGPRGAASRMFLRLARLPLVPLPAGGRMAVQPVHVDDLCEAAVRLIEPSAPAQQVIDAVGPRPMEYREMLATYREALGRPPATGWPIPSPLMSLAAHTLGRLPGVILTPDNWRMLLAGSTADPAPFAALLGHAPRDPARFLEAGTSGPGC